MSELNHEDIKNAILHAGEDSTAPVAPGPEATPATHLPDDVQIPHTPYEGFINKTPTEAERVSWKAAEDQHAAYHRDRQTAQPRETVPATPSWFRRHRIAVGTTVAGIVLAGGIGSYLSAKNGNNHDTEPLQPQTTTSAGADPGVTSSPTPEASSATEVIDNEPVTIENSPNPGAAIEQLIARQATYITAPQANQALLETILGEGYQTDSAATTLATQIEDVRLALQDTAQKMKDGNNKDAVFTSSFSVDDEDSQTVVTPEDSGRIFELDGVLSYTSNADEPPYNSPNFDFDQNYTMSIYFDSEGVWHIANEVPTGERVSTAVLE